MLNLSLASILISSTIYRSL